MDATTESRTKSRTACHLTVSTPKQNWEKLMSDVLDAGGRLKSNCQTLGLLVMEVGQ
jgi:hypothetical protein